MPIDGKYGRVTLERGTIDDDEPVVVFRARDVTLLPLLDWYRTECWHRGSPDRHLDAIADARRAVAAWQATHRTQVPESRGYTPYDRQQPDTTGETPL